MPNAPQFRTSLLQCARLISHDINRLLEPIQMNYSLWQVLYVIEQKNSCTALEIADYLLVSKPSITKRIKALSDLAVIEQIVTTDKRQKKLTLSHYGQQFYQQCAELISRYEQQLLAPFSMQQKQATHLLLKQLIASIQSSKDAPHV